MESKEGLSVRGLTTAASIWSATMCCRGSDDGPLFEYRTVIRTIDRDNLRGFRLRWGNGKTCARCVFSRRRI